MTSKEIVSELLKEIQKSIDSFGADIPGIQKQLLSKVQNILSELDRTSGRLDATAKNIKAIARLKKEIEQAILNPAYLDRVEKFNESFSVIATLQNSYFAAISVESGSMAAANALKESAIDETLTALTESGVASVVSAGVEKILKSNIIGESSYTDMVEQMRGYLLSDSSGEGALAKYSSQITTDALNQFSAQYNELLSSDLGLRWHQYVGSLKEKSREFCIKLTGKRWVHEVELPDILSGKIDGHQVPINPNTGVWYGGNPDTTVDTFVTLRGGYKCGHQYLGVIDALVPKNIREETYRKYGMEKELAELENE